MNATADIDALAREVCDRIAAHASQRTWRQRLAAAMLVIERLTGAKVEVVPVRAALYSRSASLQLGGPMMPAHESEAEHLREQVGRAMLLLGVEHLHAVLLVGSVMIELADASTWHDRGVLLRPFTTDRPASIDRWTVAGLRYGVGIAYERTDSETALLPDVAAHRIARDVHDAMRHSPHRRRAG